MTVGNDFAGVVAAVGSGRASASQSEARLRSEASLQRRNARLPWTVSEQISSCPGCVSLSAWAIRSDILTARRDHPSGRDDARQVSVVTSKRRRSLGRARVDISHETVGFWWNRFSPMFAAEIHRRRVAHMRGHPQWRWHLDEVFEGQRSSAICGAQSTMRARPWKQGLPRSETKPRR